MKILFLSNNQISKTLSDWLREKEKDVEVFDRKLTPKKIRDGKYDLIISYNYKYLIPVDILNISPNKFINLHISYLPWNKGANPNAWSFIENTPSGVTVHLMDA